MFWVCLYFFLFPDLSGEDKTQSADTEDGQSWPKGERYLSCCGVKHFHFNDISDSVAVSDHWYILRIVGSLMYCAIPAEVSANYLTYVQDCALNQQFACTDLLWFVLFFFSTYSWFANVSGAVWCWYADKSKHCTTHRWTLVNRGRCQEIHHCKLQGYTSGNDSDGQWTKVRLATTSSQYHLLKLYPNVRFFLFHKIPLLLTRYHSITCVWFLIIPPPQTAYHNTLRVIITICSIHHTYLIFPTT